MDMEKSNELIFFPLCVSQSYTHGCPVGPRQRDLPHRCQTLWGNHQSALCSFLVPHMLSAKPAQDMVNSNHHKTGAGSSHGRLFQPLRAGNEEPGPERRGDMPTLGQGVGGKVRIQAPVPVAKPGLSLPPIRAPIRSWGSPHEAGSPWHSLAPVRAWPIKIPGQGRTLWNAAVPLLHSSPPGLLLDQVLISDPWVWCG